MKHFSKPEHVISHNLNHLFDEIKSFKNRKAFEASDLYRKYNSDLNEISRSIEWRTGLPEPKASETIRVAAWNIERGACLEGIIDSFKNNPELALSDVLLLTEVDVGMGRSSNRNVPRELADALGMNYCFAASYIVLAKGDLGEQDHDEENTLSLHGTTILSRFPIEACRTVDLYRVKDYFHSDERRLGERRALVCRIRAGGASFNCAAVHLDVKSSPKQRSLQMNSLLRDLKESGKGRNLVAGDMNVSTYNLKSIPGLVGNILYRLFFVGFRGTIENYMTPEKIFERKIFQVFTDYGYSWEEYNDRKVGTIYYNINNMLTSKKTLQFVPSWAVRWLQRKLEPWKGEVPLKLDWIVGQGLKAGNPGVVEKPVWQNNRISDHNPLYVDIFP